VLDGLTTSLLLPLGIALGWAWARKARPQDSPVAPAQLLDAPISVNGSDATPEVQLTLGNLFRRRGEIDRAIELHEGLMARADLAAALRDEVAFELAEDYQQAGLMDRAEAQWQVLAAGRGPRAAAAVQELLTLAEQGRDWSQAIALATRLEAIQGASCRARIAHYHCERAEAALAAGDPVLAAREARQAQIEDARAARPRWLMGRIAEAQGKLREAVQHYQSAMELDGRYLEDVLPALEQAFLTLADEAGLGQALHDLAALHPGPALVTAQARAVIRQGGDAIPVLAEGLQRHPSRSVLKAFLDTIAPQDNVRSLGLADAAMALGQALDAMERSQPAFLCDQCGFTPRSRFWQCPSCRQWGGIHRVPDRFG
jgi:lipopolysaccharide assembly protein B